MQRNHLIIIAIIVFVLAACAATALVGVLLWPEPTVPEEPEREATDVERPVLPSTTNGGRDIPQPGPEPPQQQPTALDPFQMLPGVWQCVQGNDRQPTGSAYQFFAPVGTTGTVYLADDPSAQANWIEAEYELGADGFLVISPVSYVGFAVSSSYATQFADEATMYMWSLETGDEAMPPSVLVRVE